MWIAQTPAHALGWSRASVSFQLPPQVNTHTVPTPSNAHSSHGRLVPHAVCKDDTHWQDSKGCGACSDWDGYDCAKAFGGCDPPAVVQEKCKKTCNLCGGSGIPTWRPTTTFPTSTPTASPALLTPFPTFAPTSAFEFSSLTPTVIPTLPLPSESPTRVPTRPLTRLPTRTPTSAKYELRTSGRCGLDITLAAECGQAAVALKLGRFTAVIDSTRNPHRPPGCYFDALWNELRIDLDNIDEGNACNKYNICLCKLPTVSPTTFPTLYPTQISAFSSLTPTLHPTTALPTVPPSTVPTVSPSSPTKQLESPGTMELLRHCNLMMNTTFNKSDITEVDISGTWK